MSSFMAYASLAVIYAIIKRNSYFIFLRSLLLAVLAEVGHIVGIHWIPISSDTELDPDGGIQFCPDTG
jgi:hypothetical protein